MAQANTSPLIELDCGSGSAQKNDVTGITSWIAITLAVHDLNAFAYRTKKTKCE